MAGQLDEQCVCVCARLIKNKKKRERKKKINLKIIHSEQGFKDQ